MVKKFEYNIPKEKGIYMIWFKNTEKVYIGSSKNLHKRFGEHYSMLKNNKHHNKKLQNYINKYGLDTINFCTHIINNDLTIEELRLLEQKEIKFYNSFDNGFNLTENTLNKEGAKITIDGRKRISEKAKIRQSTPEVKEQLRLTNSGINNPNSKLKKENILFIRNNSLLTNKELSLLFNVSYKTIWRIQNNKTYK